MIPTVQDNGHSVETTGATGTEIPSDAAVAVVAEHTDTADRPIVHPIVHPIVRLPGNVIQSLIAESKLLSKEPSPVGAELQLVGEIEAVLTAPTPPRATAGDGATKAAVADDRPVSADPPTEPARPYTPAAATPWIGAASGSATPANQTGESRGPISLAGVLTDFANPAQNQPAKAVQTQQASRGSTIAVPAVHEPAGASPTPSSTVVVDGGTPPNGQPALPLVPPVAEQATASTDIGLGAHDLKPRTAEAGQSGTSKRSAETGPAPGTSVGNTPAPIRKRSAATGPAPGTTVGNTPAPIQNPTGMANVTTTPDISGPEASLDGASRAAGTPSDGTAAKAAPMISGAGASPAAAQSGVINDTPAAWGGDLRLGADSMRTAAVDQAFRGQLLQPASQQIAVQISRAVQQGADRITVHLKPASLGHISVDLEIGPDNRLSAVIAADRPETLDLMQRDARALERALNDAGLKTDSGSLSFNLRGDGSDDHAGSDDASDWSSFAAPDNADDATPPPIYARTLHADGGIDIRV